VTFRYGRHLKNRDPLSVGHVRTSRRSCPFRSSNSRFLRLAPYCFNTMATPPATPPPGLCLLPIAWLDDCGCVRGCPGLCVGSSYLPPLSFWGHASPPAVFPVDLGVDFVLPHTFIRSGSVTHLPLGFALTSASQPYTAQVHLPLVCGPVLSLCPAGPWIPPRSRRNGVRRWAIARLTTGLGLGVFAF